MDLFPRKAETPNGLQSESPIADFIGPHHFGDLRALEKAHFPRFKLIEHSPDVQPSTAQKEPRLAEDRESRSAVPESTFHRDKSVVSALKHVGSFIKEKCPGWASARLGLLLPVSVYGVLLPVVTGHLANSVTAANRSGIWTWGLALVALPVVINSIQSLRGYVDGCMENRVSLGPKRELVKQVHGLQFSQLSERPIRDEIEKVRANPSRVSTFIGDLYGLVSTNVALCAATAAMAVVNPYWAGLVLTAAIPLLFIEKRRASVVDRVESIAARYHKQLWPFFVAATDKERTVELKTLGKSEWVGARVDDLIARVVKVQDFLKRATFRASMLSNLVEDAPTIIASVALIYQAANGLISAGEMIQFFGAVRVLQANVSGVATSCGRLIENAPFVNGTFSVAGKQNAAEESNRKVFSAKEVQAFKEKLRSGEVTVSFRNVTLEREGTCILRIDQLEINPGSFVGVVGKSGAGKTTFLSLFLGINKPTTGAVELSINGERFNVSEIPLEAWHSHIGYSRQDPYDGASLSVRQSIELGVNSDDENPFSVEQALLMAMPLTHERFGMLEVLDSRIGDEYENGRKFCRGELQSFSNARAMIGNRAFTVLDEATSNLDIEGERTLIKQLDRFRGSKTQLLVSHRLESFQRANKILVFDSGVLVEEGSHRKLMRLNGYYASMYREQNGPLSGSEQRVG